MYQEISLVMSDYSDVGRVDEEETKDGNVNLAMEPSPSDKVLGIPVVKEHEVDYTADSGVDFESSSVNYIFTV